MKTTLLLLLSVFVLNVSAQSNLEKGDRYFDQNMFASAIKCYELETKSHNRKTQERALKRLADCYRITGKFELAEDLYRKIIKKYKKDPANYLNYGLSLKSSAKYAEAKLQFIDYMSHAPNDPMAAVYMASCDSAQKWLDESLGKEVKNLVSINSESSDFSPILLPNKQILFCSSREGSKQSFISLDGGHEQHRLDLYTASLSEIKCTANTETELRRLKAVNTPAHEGSACFSADGKTLYFTKTVKGKKNKRSNNLLSTLQIFVTTCDSLNHWSEPISALSCNSSNYSVMHPALSKDGKTLYYVSDKPGGFGKTDVYYSVIDTTGNWSEPINAGSIVNTFGYELFPYLANDGRLFFSSNAHAGMGQLDIFYATANNGRWNAVQNLKPPINSIGNDFGICIEPITGYGVFSSDRFNGKGAEDIYSFAGDRPTTIELHNDTLKIADLQLFDDINYVLKDDSSNQVIPMSAKDGYLSAVLQEHKAYKIITKQHGLKMNEVFLQFEKPQQNIPFSLSVLSKKLPLQVCGYYLCDPALAHRPNDLPTFQSLQTGERQIQLSKEGLFKFQYLSDVSEPVEIHSNDPNKIY